MRFTSSLLALGLVQFGQAALFRADLSVYWDLPAGLSLKTFKTTLQVPTGTPLLWPGRAKRQGSPITTPYQHDFSSFVTTSTFQPQSYNLFSGYEYKGYRTLNVTAENGATYGNLVYPGDSVLTSWTKLADKTWSNRIIITPGAYSLGNGSKPAGDASHEISRTVAAADFTEIGWGLAMYGEQWSFGDIVYKDTEIWVDGAHDHKWCDNLIPTVEPVPTTYSEKNPAKPVVKVTHGYSAAVVYQQAGVCQLSEVRLVQPK